MLSKLNILRYSLDPSVSNGHYGLNIKYLMLVVSCQLWKLWKSVSITRATKIQLYETLVKPVALYGSECWTLKKEDEPKIRVAEVSWLREILGISRIQRIRNEVIREKL